MPKLKFICKNCKKVNLLKYKALDRVEFSKKYSNQINKKCVRCEHVSDYHVNDIYADINYSIIFAALSVCLLLGIATWYYFMEVNGSFLYVGYIMSMSIIPPVLIFSVIYKNEIKNKQLFNKLNVK